MCNYYLINNPHSVANEAVLQTGVSKQQYPFTGYLKHWMVHEINILKSYNNLSKIICLYIITCTF